MGLGFTAPLASRRHGGSHLFLGPSGPAGGSQPAGDGNVPRRYTASSAFRQQAGSHLCFFDSRTAATGSCCGVFYCGSCHGGEGNLLEGPRCWWATGVGFTASLASRRHGGSHLFLGPSEPAGGSQPAGGGNVPRRYTASLASRRHGGSHMLPDALTCDAARVRGRGIRHRRQRVRAKHPADRPKASTRRSRGG